MTNASNRGKRILLSVFACIALAACSGSDRGADGGAEGEGGSPASMKSLGMIRIDVTGIGTSTPSATVSPVIPGSPGPSGVGEKSLGTEPCAIQVLSPATSAGAFSAAGTQYVSFTFKVRNGEAFTSSSNPTCTQGQTYGAQSNLTIVGMAAPGITFSGTALYGLQLFDGSAAPDTAALTIVPTHGMVFNPATNQPEVVPAAASLQVFNESEISEVPVDPGNPAGSYLLPYGYVVHNGNDQSRTLPANPAASQYDGEFTFAIKLPVGSDAKHSVFAFGFYAQVVVDSNTRVTQSAEEQTTQGDINATLRALNLASTDLAVLGGGHVTSTNIGDPICTVRTAGTSSAPTAYLSHVATPSVASAPFNQQNIATSAGINAGFCTVMVNPVAGDFVVTGSESGVHAGTYGGGGTDLLTFAPTKAFLPGENVSFSLTTALAASGTGSHPSTPFVGSYVAGVAVPSPGHFATNTSFLASSPLVGFVTGDFNADGKPDVALISGASTISILLNNGAGGYTSSSVSVSTGSGSLSGITAGDFDLDGISDLAVAVDNGTGAAGTVRYLLNNGSASFTQAATVTVGLSPGRILLGNFYGDGLPALATECSNDGTVYTMEYLKGGGQRHAKVLTATSPNFLAGNLAAGDFNKDGNTDLAVLVSNGIEILSNSNASNQTYSVSSIADSGAQSIAVADFTGSGNLSLAVGNNNGGVLSFFLGNGDGTFSTSTNSNIDLGSEFGDLIAGDFNGDDRADLAVGSARPQGAPLILTNSGSGAFKVSTTDLLGVTVGMGIADFNGDGKPDLLLGSEDAGPSGLFTILNNGNGTFKSSELTTTSSPAGIAAADFDGDGLPDLAVAIAGSPGQIVILSDGAGGGALSQTAQFTVGNTPTGVATGDFNGDGKPDIAVTNYGSGSVSILTNTGPNAFSEATVTVGSDPEGIATGDFNGDGKTDLAVANFASGTISILTNNGSGGFTVTKSLTGASSPAYLVVGDFNADGALDIAVTNNAARGQIEIFLGDGSGNFTATSLFIGSPLSSVFLSSIAVGDFDGDGKLDLVVGERNASLTFLLVGDGVGGFKLRPSIPAGSNPDAFAVGDFNGDGKLDLAVADSGSQAVSILLNDGTGNFAISSVVTGSNPAGLAAADFTGSHKLGIAVTNGGSNTVQLLSQP